jgi:hypothetical protein
MIEAATIKVRDGILAILSENPGLSDRELTDLIKGSDTHRSQLNQACRFLETAGKLTREPRSDGRIGNYPSGVPSNMAAPDASPPRARSSTSETLSEDQVKAHLKRWLEADGTEIAWGKARGTDVIARRHNETWLIKAKGCGSRPRCASTTSLPCLERCYSG